MQPENKEGIFKNPNLLLKEIRGVPLFRLDPSAFSMPEKKGIFFVF